MLSGKHVTKLYKTPTEIIQILVNANFTINSGDFIFLTGFSGSGKSTFLKLISGEETPSHGKIEFQNLPIHELNEQAYLKFRQSLGIIYQDYRLIEHKNVFENIAFVLEALGYPEKQIMQIIQEVLDIVGLRHRAESYPEELSGGEKRRVTIARAIAINPLLILADEPTGDLDPYNTQLIMKIMKKVAERGTTIIMSTHHIELVQDYPDARIWYLQKGELFKDIAYDNLIEFYFNHNSAFASKKNSKKTRKYKLLKNLQKINKPDLYQLIKNIPDIVLENIEQLTPSILEKYYNINNRNLKIILQNI